MSASEIAGLCESLLPEKRAEVADSARIGPHNDFDKLVSSITFNK